MTTNEAVRASDKGLQFNWSVSRCSAYQPTALSIGARASLNCCERSGAAELLHPFLPVRLRPLPRMVKQPGSPTLEIHLHEYRDGVVLIKLLRCLIGLHAVIGVGIDFVEPDGSVERMRRLKEFQTL